MLTSTASLLDLFSFFLLIFFFIILLLFSLLFPWLHQQVRERFISSFFLDFFCSPWVIFFVVLMSYSNSLLPLHSSFHHITFFLHYVSLFPSLHSYFPPIICCSSYVFNTHPSLVCVSVCWEVDHGPMKRFLWQLVPVFFFFSCGYERQQAINSK